MPKGEHTMPKTTILSILISCILALSFLAPSSTDAAILNANDAVSLIAAINIANANPDFDTILLTDNIILNAVDNMTNGANGLPAIVNDVEINGQGFSINRNGGAPNFRFFYISSDDHLTLRNMTLSGGSVLGGSSPDGAGGAILNDNYLGCVDIST